MAAEDREREKGGSSTKKEVGFSEPEPERTGLHSAASSPMRPISSSCASLSTWEASQLCDIAPQVVSDMEQHRTRRIKTSFKDREIR